MELVDGTTLVNVDVINNTGIVAINRMNNRYHIVTCVNRSGSTKQIQIRRPFYKSIFVLPNPNNNSEILLYYYLNNELGNMFLQTYNTNGEWRETSSFIFKKCFWFTLYPDDEGDIESNQIQLQNKQVEITQNGTETIYPDIAEGYDALNSVEVTTSVEQQVRVEIVKNAGTYSNNGIDYLITPSSGYDAMRQVQLSIDVPQTPSLNIKNTQYESIFTNGVHNITPTPQGTYDGMAAVQASVWINNKTLSITADTNHHTYRASDYTISDGSYFDGDPYVGFSEVTIDVPTGQTINNYNIGTITTNGSYTIPSSYTGFDDFTVAIPIYESINSTFIDAPASYQPIGSVWAITATKTVSPPTNYTAQTNVEVSAMLEKTTIRNPGTHTFNPSNKIYQNSIGWYEVQVDIQPANNKDVDANNNNVITSNGTFTVPTGFTGWNSFEVAVPSQNILATDTITLNGHYTSRYPYNYYAPVGYDGVAHLEITTNPPLGTLTVDSTNYTPGSSQTFIPSMTDVGFSSVTVDLPSSMAYKYTGIKYGNNNAMFSSFTKNTSGSTTQVTVPANGTAITIENTSTQYNLSIYIKGPDDPSSTINVNNNMYYYVMNYGSSTQTNLSQTLYLRDNNVQAVLPLVVPGTNLTNYHLYYNYNILKTIADFTGLP